MPDGVILPEVQIDILKRNDERAAQVRRTLEALRKTTSLPWTVSQHSKAEPYSYALDDTHVPLNSRLAWEAYHDLATAINEALNSNGTLVDRHKHRRDIFPYGGERQGLRFATVGGTLYNGTRLATSFLLSAAMEDELALAEIERIDLSRLAQPIRQLLKMHDETGARTDAALETGLSSNLPE